MASTRVYWAAVAAALVVMLLYTLLAEPVIDKSKLLAYVYKSGTTDMRSRSSVYIPPSMDISLNTLSTKSLQDPKSADLSKAVFVTAADYSHFKESKDSIASIQKHLPGHTIIYYDIGLWWSSYVREVKSWCGVIYRQLDFTKYPAHLRSLHSCAWKPIIIQEVLQEHDTIVWLDASIRIKCPNLLKQLEPTVRKSGITIVDHSGHSSFAATHPGMYDFLSVDKDLTTNNMFGAGFLALTNSRQIFDHVIVWWVRCAIWKDCIEPPGSGPVCHFSVKNSNTTYAHCHRYDQSALNLLLVDMFKGDVSMYRTEGACISVERDPTSYYQLQYCKRQ